MAEDVADNDAWLVGQITEHGSVNGRARTGSARLSVSAGTLRDLVLVASRPAGLRASGLKVLGRLDFSHAEIKGPIDITDSELTGGIDCSNAICVSVNLTDSSFSQLNCDGARTQHDLVLDRVNVGLVVLQDAEIGGSLLLSGANLTGHDGMSVIADRVRVAGGVFCQDGFSAIGEARFLGAAIGGSLDLTGGQFSNPGDDALSADRMRVAGGVFCRNGFSAIGTIRLAGATIGGHLDLTGGRFSNPSGLALSAERADIGTLTFVEANPDSAGGASFIGSHIGYLEDRPVAWRRFHVIELLDLTYDRINYGSWTTEQRLQWLRKTGAHQNQPYEQLAVTLRAQGHEREAKKILIAKHAQQRLAQPWYTRFPGLLFGALLAYGYKPLQRTVPLLLSLYLLGAFWLLPQARDARAVIATRVPVHTTTTAAPLPPGQAPQPIVATKHCPIDYPCFSSWAYTLDVLVPLVNTHQTDYWTISSRHGDRGAIWYIRLAPALGWLLSTAAALGFTGLIRREA